MSPLTLSSTSPSSQPGSIFDFRSSIPKIEIADWCAFAESEPNVLDCAIPTLANTKAKKTYKITKCNRIM